MTQKQIDLFGYFENISLELCDEVTLNVYQEKGESIISLKINNRTHDFPIQQWREMFRFVNIALEMTNPMESKKSEEI